MKMKSIGDRLRLAAIIASLLVFFFAAGRISSSPQPGAPAAETEVRVDNFTFMPGTLTVARGTTVKWVNRDDIPHTVVSDDKTTFKSKALETDDSFTYTFDKPGTYTYFCSIHPKMTAKVVVQ
jgi:plastocyanin